MRGIDRLATGYSTIFKERKRRERLAGALSLAPKSLTRWQSQVKPAIFLPRSQPQFPLPKRERSGNPEAPLERRIKLLLTYNVSMRPKGVICKGNCGQIADYFAPHTRKFGRVYPAFSPRIPRIQADWNPLFIAANAERKAEPMPPESRRLAEAELSQYQYASIEVGSIYQPAASLRSRVCGPEYPAQRIPRTAHTPHLKPMPPQSGRLAEAELSHFSIQAYYARLDNRRCRSYAD